MYIRAQSPIVFQRHISGTCLFSNMYRGCVFFHLRLHQSVIVHMTPTWIVFYVLIGRDMCSPADSVTSPPPLSILFFGQYYFMFVHVCQTHNSYTIARCKFRCVSSLPHFLASGCLLYYITKSSLLSISHNCMLFSHFVIGYHLSNSMLLALPIQLAHRMITGTVINACVYTYVPSCHAVITY